ncbi:MAG TPA: LuxR C-terminal-related transcriptional regulator [Pyrinomonadaceae bacterium]|nr:LuxR C-terminal-related transcriptional regulator [Pyrinomonadaceae bacterium]
MSFKRFHLLLDGTADAAFAVDSAGRISAWNKAAAELFGLSEAQVINDQCHKVFQCADENGPVCSERCVIERAAVDEGLLTNFDLRIQTRSGKLWCNLSALIANDSVSRVRHAIYIVRPVEIQKRLEQALSEFVRTQTLPAPHVNVRLTSREVEVLKSLAKGHSTRKIANQLNISSATVNNHVKHILTKFDAHTRLEAIRHAESVGVI